MDMNGLWLASYVALWIVVAILSVIVLGLVRQLGLIHLRLGPEQNLWTTREGLEIGSAAPGFRAMDVLHGEELTLQNLKGKPSVLVFLSPTCGPCVELMPHIRDFQKSKSGRVSLVLLSQASPQSSREFAITHQLNVPVISDADGEIFKTYQAPATPFAYRLDKEGVVRRRGVVNTFEALEALLDDASSSEPMIQLPNLEKERG